MTDGNLRCMTSTYLFRGSEVLLLYRVGSRVLATPCWCGIGGHFEKDELNDARACALRELREETGLCAEDLRGLEMRYVTMRLKNGEVRLNCYFFASLISSREPMHDGSEGRLAWVDTGEALSLPMPFTAKQVLRHYLQEGMRTALLYGGATTPDGVSFTPLEEF